MEKVAGAEPPGSQGESGGSGLSFQGQSEFALRFPRKTIIRADDVKSGLIQEKDAIALLDPLPVALWTRLARIDLPPALAA